jgi:hypothetical protein
MIGILPVNQRRPLFGLFLSGYRPRVMNANAMIIVNPVPKRHFALHLLLKGGDSAQARKIAQALG